MFKDSVALFPCAAGTITISGESYNMQYASMLALQKSCGLPAGWPQSTSGTEPIPSNDIVAKSWGFCSCPHL